MDLTEIIQPGMAKEEHYLVEEEHSASHVGSGSLRVLATPWMIAYIERVARDFLAERLPAGYSSVGVRVDVQHLAPSLVGSRVRIRVEVRSVEGMRVNFAVESWDGTEQIGAGEHQRVVIDEDRFLKRLEQRIAAKAGPGENPAAPNGE